MEFTSDFLRGKNIVVFDTEIKKEIADCKRGWDGHDEMGVSVACAFDYRTGCYRVFMDDNLGELVERLNEPGTLVVAFNHINFDNKLLRATAGLPPLRPDAELRNYDMLRVSRRACGMNEQARTPGFKLQQHLMAMGLPTKTADGAEAPGMWKAQKLGKLIDYCLNDVFTERALFEKMWKTGQAACEYRKTPYDIERPEISA